MLEQFDLSEYTLKFSVEDVLISELPALRETVTVFLAKKGIVRTSNYRENYKGFSNFDFETDISTLSTPFYLSRTIYDLYKFIKIQLLDRKLNIKLFDLSNECEPVFDISEIVDKNSEYNQTHEYFKRFCSDRGDLIRSRNIGKHITLPSGESGLITNILNPKRDLDFTVFVNVSKTSEPYYKTCKLTEVNSQLDTLTGQ